MAALATLTSMTSGWSSINVYLRALAVTDTLALFAGLPGEVVVVLALFAGLPGEVVVVKVVMVIVVTGWWRWWWWSSSSSY